MPTPSSTASSTTPIASISPATACDEPDQDQPQRIDPQLASRQNPPASRTPLKRATSCRNTERHDLGTTGRHRRNQHVPFERRTEASPSMGASSDPTPLKPGNAGGGKGPQFKTDARRGEGPGDWET